MDYFAKKQWIRIAVCAVLVAVGVLAMTGVFSGNQPLMYDPASTNGLATVSAEATEQNNRVRTRRMDAIFFIINVSLSIVASSRRLCRYDTRARLQLHVANVNNDGIRHESSDFAPILPTNGEE